MKTLCDFRKQLGLTQIEMAKKLNVSYSYYTKIENENKPPSYNFIKRLKEIYPEINTNIFFDNKEHE